MVVPVRMLSLDPRRRYRMVANNFVASWGLVDTGLSYAAVVKDWAADFELGDTNVRCHISPLHSDGGC